MTWSEHAALDKLRPHRPSMWHIYHCCTNGLIGIPALEEMDKCDMACVLHAIYDGTSSHRGAGESIMVLLERLMREGRHKHCD